MAFEVPWILYVHFDLTWLWDGARSLKTILTVQVGTLPIPLLSISAAPLWKQTRTISVSFSFVHLKEISNHFWNNIEWHWVTKVWEILPSMTQSKTLTSAIQLFFWYRGASFCLPFVPSAFFAMDGGTNDYDKQNPIGAGFQSDSESTRGTSIRVCCSSSWVLSSLVIDSCSAQGTYWLQMGSCLTTSWHQHFTLPNYVTLQWKLLCQTMWLRRVLKQLVCLETILSLRWRWILGEMGSALLVEHEFAQVASSRF